MCLLRVISVGFRLLFHHPAIHHKQHERGRTMIRTILLTKFFSLCNLTILARSCHLTMETKQRSQHVWSLGPTHCGAKQTTSVQQTANLFKGRGVRATSAQSALGVHNWPQLLSSSLRLGKPCCCAVHVPSMQAVDGLLRQLLNVCAARRTTWSKQCRAARSSRNI
jgi:hypothetical protein